MNKFYKINNHGSNRMAKKFSVDQVNASGAYICQEAFYFASADAARERAIEMIAEDAAAKHTVNPVNSTLLEGVGKV
jgi:hypothetical protein